MRSLALLIATLVAGGSAAPALACATEGTGAKCVTARDTAGARTNGAKWLSVPPRPLPFEVGEILPEKYLVLMNTAYYGLPPTGPGWRYYRVEDQLYRVESGTRRILAVVTDQANDAF